MASMDIFNTSAFSMTSLTGAVDKMDYMPQLLGQLGIFEPMPVRTRTLWIDRRDGALVLIPTSPTGAPPESLVKDDRDAVSLRTTRLAKEFTLYAEEIQDIRAFGSETEMMQVQAEYLRRMSRIRADMELTHEYHRLGALQGVLLDADGSTVIYDYFDEFGVPMSAAGTRTLSASSTTAATPAPPTRTRATTIRKWSSKSSSAICSRSTPPSSASPATTSSPRRRARASMLEWSTNTS